MELDYSAMFRNKLIGAGEFMAQVVFVQPVSKADGQVAYHVEIELGNNESQYDGTRMTVILQPTPKGQRFIEAFEESYRVGPATVQEAVGRWASVYVYEALYKGSAYGAVKFHKQMAVAKEKAAELETQKCQAVVMPAAGFPGGIIDWEEVQSVGSTDKLNSGGP